MMGVNDLAEGWAEYRDSCRESSNPDCASGFEICRKDLQQVARTAWKPVSEPPTEADGDERGEVLVLDNGVDRIDWWLVKEWYERGIITGQWARIRDVVLMPPEVSDGEA